MIMSFSKICDKFMTITILLLRKYSSLNIYEYKKV